ncbi:hypothetical protein Pfo_026650 [Paulownia fortunei]|nr:hypothetical protein Pfo_026650 [Paulownia fortunei]
MAEGQTSKGKRPMETPSKPTVTVCIKSQDGSHAYYKISRNTNIQKLLRAYCDERQLEYGTVVFLHDGDRLAVRGTMDQLGIEDGDEIDAMISQTGGGPPKNVYVRRLVTRKEAMLSHLDFGFKFSRKIIKKKKTKPLFSMHILI